MKKRHLKEKQRMKALADKQRKRKTWKRNKDRKKTVTKCETKKEEVYVERETWKRNSERNRERERQREWERMEGEVKPPLKWSATKGNDYENIFWELLLSIFVVKTL